MWEKQMTGSLLSLSLYIAGLVTYIFRDEAGHVWSRIFQNNKIPQVQIVLGKEIELYDLPVGSMYLYIFTYMNGGFSW